MRKVMDQGKTKGKRFHDRIGIIGAGPAGLSVAEALRDAGYFNITLLEARDRAGGKALSKEFIAEDGTKTIYELGSIQPTGSKKMFKLIKRYDLHFAGPGEMQGFSIEKGRAVVSRLELLTRNPFKLLADAIKLLPALIKYRRLKKPGFHNFKYTKELSVNSKEFVQSFNFKILKDLVRVLVGAIGTAFVPSREVGLPAIYPMKLLYGFARWPWSYFAARATPIKEGYQELWNRIAKSHHVYYRSPVVNIDRSGKAIKVETRNGDQYEFDHLVMTINPKLTKDLKGLTAEEEKFFSKVRYCPGYRWAAEVENAPTKFWYWITEANEWDKIKQDGQMSFFFHCFPKKRDTAMSFMGVYKRPNPFLKNV